MNDLMPGVVHNAALFSVYWFQYRLKLNQKLKEFTSKASSSILSLESHTFRRFWDLQ